jgi:hypothetical protein
VVPEEQRRRSTRERTDINYAERYGGGEGDDDDLAAARGLARSGGGKKKKSGDGLMSMKEVGLYKMNSVYP